MTIPLTQPPGTDLNAAMSATPSGMAWVIGTGPEGTTCGGCALWSGRFQPEHHHKTGKLKPAPCERYTQLMRRNVVEIVGEKVEPTNASCRDYAPNLAPPTDIPPVIEGSNIRDTTVRGLGVKFVGVGASATAVVSTPRGRLLDIALRKGLGRTVVVDRINASRLAEVDWTVAPRAGFDAHLVREAERQILAAP